MINSLSEFLEEVRLTIVAAWNRANEEVVPVVRWFVIALFAVPIVNIIVFAAFFSAAIPVIGLLGLMLVIWLLFWRFQYPVVYAALIWERGKKVMLHFIFVIAVECFFGYLLAMFGMLLRGEGLNEFSLNLFMVFGIVTIGVLSIGLVSDHQKALKWMIAWTVVGVIFAGFLLAFPPVREKLPVTRLAFGYKIAARMADTTSPPPVSTAGFGSTGSGSVPEEDVDGLTQVDGSRPGTYSVSRETTMVVATGDTATTIFTISRKGMTRARLTVPDTVTILWQDTVGVWHRLREFKGETFYDPCDAPARDPQVVRLVARKPQAITVGVVRVE